MAVEYGWTGFEGGELDAASPASLRGGVAGVRDVAPRSGQYCLTINPDTVLTNCRLWVASYRDDSPRMPSAWPTWVLWQYTDGSAGPMPHSVPGVSSCDRSFFNGTENDLIAFWGT